MSGEILGIGLHRFDGDVLRSTQNLCAAAVAANEARAAQIEPGHLLVALGRIHGGLTASLFARHGFTPDDLCDALREPAPAQVFITEVLEETVSEATREVFRALPPDTDDRDRIDERRMLAAILPRLERRAVTALEFGRADLATWIAEVTAPWAGPAIFDDAGLLAEDAFSPGARRVLATAVTEAGGLGRPGPDVVLFLYAMAAVPNGAVEQACIFMRHQVRGVQAQLLLLTGGRLDSAVAPVAMNRHTMDRPLRRIVEQAAAVAAARRSPAIAERDLLAALLAVPGGLAATFFRDVGIDQGRLLHYVTDLYSEPTDRAPGAQAPPPSLAEAMAELRQRVIGQPAVIEKLSPHLETIVRAVRRGVRLGHRPRGTFLFAGPSGTGKTMTARALAKVIYGTESDLVMFEMGQFNTRESINNFIGAPPGYVGFGDGKLTNALRDNPRRLLLFDEVEKADQRVYDALLRLLDEGQISDPAGPIRDARESVIVLTSNIDGRTRRAPASEFGIAPGVGFAAWVADDPAEPAVDPREGVALEDDGRSKLRSALETFFRPEFLNRIDELVIFSSFGAEEQRLLSLAGLEGQARMVQETFGVDLVWGEEVPGHIVATARSARRKEAARGIDRCVAGILPELLRLLDEAEAKSRVVRRVRAAVLDGRLTVAEESDG